MNPTRYFRWFDQGDLQSVEMLTQIAAICLLTPKVKHWLPTREVAMVKEFLRRHECPPNLHIRISANLIDGVAPKVEGCGRSSVHRAVPPRGAYECPAHKQGNVCDGPLLNCRACWSKAKRYETISYPAH